MDRMVEIESEKDEMIRETRKKRYTGHTPKKEYPISVKITIDLIITGIFWFVSGLLYAISLKTGLRVYKLMLIGTLSSLIICKILVFKMTFTEGDEMSEIHYQKARADTYSNMLSMISVWALMATVFDIFKYTLISNWYAWILMVIGFMEFYAGIKFYRLEKGGDV